MLLATLGAFQGDCTKSCAFQLGTAEFLQPGLSSSGDTGAYWKALTFRAGPEGRVKFQNLERGSVSQAFYCVELPRAEFNQLQDG